MYPLSTDDKCDLLKYMFGEDYKETVNGIVQSHSKLTDVTSVINQLISQTKRSNDI